MSAPGLCWGGGRGLPSPDIPWPLAYPSVRFGSLNVPLTEVNTIFGLNNSQLVLLSLQSQISEVYFFVLFCFKKEENWCPKILLSYLEMHQKVLALWPRPNISAHMIIIQICIAPSEDVNWGWCSIFSPLQHSDGTITAMQWAENWKLFHTTPN